MKYTILINQAAVVEADLHKTTDLVDWAILEYITAWQTNPEAERNEDFVWINYKHFIAEMPLVGLNTKGSVSRRLTKLERLNLIEKILDEDGRAFCKTTALFHQIIQFKAKKSSKPIGYDGKHPGYDGKHPVYDGKQSTNNHKQTINNNNNNHEPEPVTPAQVSSLLSSLTENETTAPTPIVSEAKNKESKEKAREFTDDLLLNGLVTDKQKALINKKLSRLAVDQRVIAIQMFNDTAAQGRIKKTAMALINQLVNMGLNNELEPPVSVFNPQANVVVATKAEKVNTRDLSTIERLSSYIAKHKAEVLATFQQMRAVHVHGMGVFYKEDLAAAGLFD